MNDNTPNQEHPLLRLILSAATLIALVTMVVTLAVKGTRNDLQVGPDNQSIGEGSIEIKSVTDIGQWEFLTLSDEELVDSTESRLLGSDKKITRIYYGTLRLGIDLSKLANGGIRMREDTLDVKLPPVELLDSNFIDETRTQSFFEKGSWDHQARQALYEKAKRQMKARCMTEDNINIAQVHAVEEVSQLFRSMGYQYIDIHF